MDATNSTEALVADGGLAVAFEVIAAGRVVKCTVSRESLQRYFWLQSDADDARVFKIFNDGSSLSPNARRFDSRPLLSTWRWQTFSGKRKRDVWQSQSGTAI